MDAHGPRQKIVTFVAHQKAAELKETKLQADISSQLKYL